MHHKIKTTEYINIIYTLYDMKTSRKWREIYDYQHA